MHRINREYLE